MLKSMVVLLAGAMAAGAASAQKEKISFAYLVDPVYQAALWPLQTGKVASDVVEVELKPIDITAALQATPAKSYDAIMTAVAGIPVAKSRGLDLVVIATAYRAHPKGGGYDIFVRSDSPLRTLADLKGKTLGNFALQATVTTQMRIALWRKHGVNTAYSGGDYNWVEMPSAALPGALLSGRIDAATLLNTQAWLAENDSKFRVLQRLGLDVREVFEGPPAAAVHVSYPEKLAARPAAYREFGRLLKASVDYMHANRESVFAAMAAQTKTDPALFRYFYDGYAQVPMAVSNSDIVSFEKLWSFSKEMGLIKSYPDPSSVIWSGAIRE